MCVSVCMCVCVCEREREGGEREREEGIERERVCVVCVREREGGERERGGDRERESMCCVSERERGGGRAGKTGPCVLEYWPSLPPGLGFNNWTEVIQGPIDSVYMRLRQRNRCNHKDYQNIAVNGRSSRTQTSDTHSHCLQPLMKRME